MSSALRVPVIAAWGRDRTDGGARLDGTYTHVFDVSDGGIYFRVEYVGC